MELRDYPREFVERTLMLLNENYDDMRTKNIEVTFLINCLLGLIVATFEKLDKCEGNFFGKKLSDPEIAQFIPDKIATISLNLLNKTIKEAINKKSLIGQHDNRIDISGEIIIAKRKEANGLTLKEFIRNIRNGVAHQNLSGTNQSDIWKGVRIRNHDRNGIKDFEVEFKIGQLKEFAIFIGKKFLEHLPTGRK